ncbi:MAG: hypothetical protein ACFFCE_03785 [Promethearchaeota archaeon]
MSFLYFFTSGKRNKQKNQGLKTLVCIFLVSIILLSFVYIKKNNFSVGSSEDSFNNNNKDSDKRFNNLQTTSITSMLTDPFTNNFEQLRDFFEINYQSSLDFDIPVYFREGDNKGDITNDTIFSEDQLLYYNSLMKMELNDLETFNLYLELKNTTLWQDNKTNEFDYGFVQSINGTTGQIYKDERYLIDNVLPIFLLIENIGADIRTISINGEKPTKFIDEMFLLINSSEFWDEQPTYNGFFNSNSSSKKYTESNLYAILANLLIHRTYYDIGINPMIRDKSIRDRAMELANLTMIDLVDEMWDTDDYGFWYNADENWTITGLGDNLHLSTNALGIITLLEFWIASGMQNDSNYLQMAKDLYKSINAILYNSTYNLYMNVAQPDWIDVYDDHIYLDSNAMMMRACLKLFEVSGNISYYDRAINISKSIESNLYDSSYNAYNSSISDIDKSFNSNLKLSNAYLDAFEIYNSTILNCKYNISAEVPDFIFNQDIMNLTSIYSFKKSGKYFNSSEQSYIPFTVKYDISNANVSYIIKKPDNSFLKEGNLKINRTTASYSLIYPIKEDLPLEDGYYIYIWANTSYFKLTNSTMCFNVISGLINKSMEGLVSKLIQGAVINVSLLVNSIRSEDIILTASLEGDQLLEYPSQQINFTASEDTRINFNLTAKPDATPGDSDIYFRIKKDDVIYLEIKKSIEIGYPFEYSNLIYQGKVVSGDSISVSMNIKNNLPDTTQNLNISFSGIGDGFIEDFIQEEILEGDEIKTVSYSLESVDNIYNETISIKMSILVYNTEFYSESFRVEIIPKFELISVSFPEKVPQGAPAYLILILKNNQENSEEFSLNLNGKPISTNLKELSTGENRIVAKIVPSINPYEFGSKNYRFVLRDGSNNEIERFYFKTSLELSVLNLVLFYILPIIVPIGLVLFFKNRDIKHKKLIR